MNAAAHSKTSGRCALRNVGQILIDGIPIREVARRSIASGLATLAPPRYPPKTPEQIAAYKAKRRATIRRCQADYKRRLLAAKLAAMEQMRDTLKAAGNEDEANRIHRKLTLCRNASKRGLRRNRRNR